MALADKIHQFSSGHVLQAVVAEVSRGTMTQQQAVTALETAWGGLALTASEVTELANLIASVTSIAISGSATAQADARARRALRLQEIDQVLLLADQHLPPYTTPAALKTRLGF